MHGSAFSVGRIVVINPYLHCGTCPACLAGQDQLLRTLKVLGVHRDGGMCE